MLIVIVVTWLMMLIIGFFLGRHSVFKEFRYVRRDAGEEFFTRVDPADYRSWQRFFTWWWWRDLHEGWQTWVAFRDNYNPDYRERGKHGCWLGPCPRPSWIEFLRSRFPDYDHESRCGKCKHFLSYFKKRLEKAVKEMKGVRE